MESTIIIHAKVINEYLDAFRALGAHYRVILELGHQGIEENKRADLQAEKGS